MDLRQKPVAVVHQKRLRLRKGLRRPFDGQRKVKKVSRCGAVSGVVHILKIWLAYLPGDFFKPKSGSWTCPRVLKSHVPTDTLNSAVDGPGVVHARPIVQRPPLVWDVLEI